MDWNLTLLNVVLGTLVPCLVLWGVGEKMNYDFPFWELLIINACGASVRQVPDIGVWISLPVYYVLYCLPTGINLVGAVWMTLLSYFMYSAIGFLVLTGFARQDPAVTPAGESGPAAMMEANAPAEMRGSQKPDVEKPRNSAALSHADIEVSKKLREKYRVDGIAGSESGWRAIINGTIYSEGDVLDPGVVIERVKKEHVVVRYEGALITLDIAPVF